MNRSSSKFYHCCIFGQVSPQWTLEDIPIHGPDPHLDPHSGSGLICLGLCSDSKCSCFTSNFHVLMKNEHRNIKQHTAVLTSWAASIEKSVAGRMAVKRSDILHNRLALISHNSKHTCITIIQFTLPALIQQFTSCLFKNFLVICQVSLTM